MPGNSQPLAMLKHNGGHESRQGRSMIQRLMSLPVLLVLAILVGSVALFAARTAAQSGPLTLTEIVELKKLGFTEADIKAEVTRARGSYTLSAPDLQTLNAAGFSADFVAFLQALRPQQRLTNASIIAMGQRRLPADEMLREIRSAERVFDTSPRALLALAKNHQVPAVVLRAMQGQPLSAEGVRELAAKGASGPQLLLLLDIVGVTGGGLSPTQALELSRAGVPEEVVFRLRHLPDAQGAGASLGDLPHAGYYPHPLGLFTLHYPTN